jgi:putative heme-binding domain-containing protein
LAACGENRLGRQATLAAAKDENASVRRQAIRQLGSRAVREAVPLLKACLTHQDAGVRFEAATALGRTGSAQAAPALLHQLGEKDSFVRFSVFTAMNRIGRADPAAWKALAKGLESSQPAVRQGTEFALRNTYDPVLLDLLIALAGNSRQQFETRDAALRLCIELHHQPPEWKGEWWAYHPALAVPQEKDVAWAGTPKILALLRRTLTDSDPRFRLAAVNGLAAARDSSSSPALRSSFEQERAPEVRSAIIAALGKFKDSAFAPRLSQLLPEPKLDPDTLSVAVRAAGNIGGDELKAALLNLAADTRIDSIVRIEAVNALSLLKSKDASVRLELLLKENHPAIRAAAIKAIAQISGIEALPLLRSFLTNGPVDLRKEAVIAVGKLHERSAVPDLLIAWHSPETRAEALEALSQVSDSRALAAYLDGLASTNPTVRERCRNALSQFRQDALPLIESKSSSLNLIALGELRELYKGDARAERGILFTNQLITLGLDDYERYGSEQAGDPFNGQRIFFDETGVACIKCHAVAGHGGAVGPDLTLIGAQFPRKDLIEHVLYPSRVVREGYQQVMVETRDGETSSGIIKSETGDSLTLLNVEGKLASIPKSTIVNRLKSSLSLMPEGLQAGLSLAQFADLLAFLEARRVDPRQPAPDPPPPGFVPLLNGRDLAGWREVPAGTKRVTMTPANQLQPPAHWRVNQSILEHDGTADDLWTERQFQNFILRLDWRWVDRPIWENFPVINRDGVEAMSADGKPITERVLDAGDSGVLLRGLYKAQANLFCYPVGSGEVWEYRTDPTLSTDQRRALTPSRQADRPLGDWNRMEISVRGDRLTVVLNEEKVIADAELPGIPSQGPIGLQHEHGRIQFANIFVHDLP